MARPITWPDGKRFAFTVFDDTDFVTLDKVAGVYSLLRDHGVRTTKSVWPVRGLRQPKLGGLTCDDAAYLNWLRELRSGGFEIGFHNATFHTSYRDETVKALDRFAELFGKPPKTMANHAHCEESIYWGANRVSGINRLVYNLATRNRKNGKFRGHIAGDELFWGDLCRDQITYVRNFVFRDINTLKACPDMPYHDTDRPLVPYWFASSEGPSVLPFNRCISEENQDRLEEQGGACIMYTHFACGFQTPAGIDRRFEQLIARLSRKNGWFVPVGELLDYLLAVNGSRAITPAQRNRLERRWIMDKLFLGTS